MTDIQPQTASGKVLLHFLISLDGFVAGPGHSMDWMAGITSRPGLVEEYIETTGAVLAGRDGFESAIDDSRPYGGRWKGPIFVLTHHPEDARPAPDVTFLNCSVEQAVRIGLEAAGGKNLEVFSPTSASSFWIEAWSTSSTSTWRRCCSAAASGSTTPPAASRCGSRGSAPSRRSSPVCATGRSTGLPKPDSG